MISQRSDLPCASLPAVSTSTAKNVRRGWRAWFTTGWAVSSPTVDSFEVVYVAEDDTQHRAAGGCVGGAVKVTPP